jgi:nucleoside 2-deoxyribosyltransferase
MLPRPKIFIASPLFNPAQHAVLDELETAIKQSGFDFYSARHHSGSDKLTPEQKRVLSNWDPIFDSNVQGLESCRVCIANIGYQYPDGTFLGLCKEGQKGLGLPKYDTAVIKPLELPDAGTVWEMGFMRAQAKLVIGYHPDAQPTHLNLMLSHGCDGIITGVQNLQWFLSGAANSKETNSVHAPERLRQRCQQIRDTYGSLFASTLWDDACLFDWTACHQFDAQSKEVE